MSIFDLPAPVQALAAADRELFDRLFRVSVSEGRLRPPESMRGWLEGRFGSVEGGGRGTGEGGGGGAADGGEGDQPLDAGGGGVQSAAGAQAAAGGGGDAARGRRPALEAAGADARGYVRPHRGEALPHGGERRQSRGLARAHRFPGARPPGVYPRVCP